MLVTLTIVAPLKRAVVEFPGVNEQMIFVGKASDGVIVTTVADVPGAVAVFNVICPNTLLPAILALGDPAVPAPVPVEIVGTPNPTNDLLANCPLIDALETVMVDIFTDTLSVPLPPI